MYKDFNEKIFEILLIILVCIVIATAIQIGLDISLDVEDVKGVVSNIKVIDEIEGI